MSTAAIDRQGSARPVQAVLDFFSSIKLTVCLLISLAATSIIGTVIPQKEAPEAYIEAYGQAKYELFKALQFTDLYHSWWFIGLLAVLITNLLVCSLRRLPTTLRAMVPPNYRIDEGFFPKQHQHASFQTRLPAAEVGARAAPLIRTWFSARGAPLWLLALIAGLVGVFAGLIISGEQWAVLTTVGVCEAAVVGAEMVRRGRVPLPQARTATNPEEGQDGVIIHAEKGRASRLGVYVVHVSIILIMAGAIIGLLYGVRGAVRIGEGDTVNYFWVRHPQHKEALPFGVRVDDFSVSFYETGQPKEFKSMVSIIEDGKAVQTTPVLVNSPLSYGGYRLYQSDYGPIGLTGLKLSVQPRAGGEASVLEVPGFNRPIPLPGGGTVSVVDTQENLVGLGPAFRLRLEKASGEKPAEFWVFQRLRDFDRDRGGEFVFGVAEADMRYYSGLEFSRDPGVWIVWAGCTLMVLGFLVAFFMSHRRLWLRAVPKAGGKTLVQVGGRTNKNRPGFETEFAALCEALKGELR